jgi:prevent-host-death family protein
MMWLYEAPLYSKVDPVMPRIGLRDLKIHASQVLRDVEKNRIRYVVTKRGEPQAIIIPYSAHEESAPADREAAWNRIADALAEVRRSWDSPLTAEEIIRDMRH